MKKIGLLLLMGMVLLASCQDFDYGMQPMTMDEEAIQNAALALGVSIDTSHDWSTTNKGSITITADADLDDIAKVQVLTASPFFNADASVLTELSAKKGETVTLHYDAPKTYARLIAACVSSKGEYYIKGFNIGTEHISFSKSTRAVGDVVSGDYPDVAKLQLEYKYSTPSYNARRTILANEAVENNDAELLQFVNDNHINLWQGKQWEKERLWGTRNNNVVDLGGGWIFENSTVVRVIDDIDEEEAANLQDIFDTYLGRNNIKGKRQDNMEAIRNSPDVRINYSHIVSTGVAPITVTPVLMASSDLNKCHLYYYYYNPSDIPSGMTEEEYLKTLPKFRAIMCHHTLSAAGINTSTGSDTFFKKHEYMLPYYGDPNELIGVKGEIKNMCKTDGKLYRIRLGQQYKDASYYLTYLVSTKTNQMSDRLATLYDDNANNIADQLWQIFKDPLGRVLLYNVGSQKYLCPEKGGSTGYTLWDDEEKAKSDVCTYIMNEEDGYWRFSLNNDDTKCLGTDLGGPNNAKKDSKRVSSNKGVADGERSKWYLEPYEGSKQIAKKEDFVHSTTPLVIKAESNIIPKGYRVGFMLRKLAGSQDEKENKIVVAEKNGCCYGDRRLNQEINQFPTHFSNALSLYSMTMEDPRMAMFEVNGKTYLTFEDGSDCNFSDLIIEMGGGAAILGYIPDVFGQVYTFCFEDREEGDYDLNDIVIKAVRLDATHVKYSLEACGGMDKIYLRNLGGNVLNDDTELHSLFNTTSTVNVGSSHVEGVSEIVTVDPSFSIADEQDLFYLYNATTGKEIHIAEMGEDPHAIMVPCDFDYPLEGVCIKDAYPAFVGWAKDRYSNPNWYEDPEIDKCTYHQSVFEYE